MPGLLSYFSRFGVGGGMLAKIVASIPSGLPPAGFVRLLVQDSGGALPLLRVQYADGNLREVPSLAAGGHLPEMRFSSTPPDAAWLLPAGTFVLDTSSKTLWFCTDGGTGNTDAVWDRVWLASAGSPPPDYAWQEPAELLGTLVEQDAVAGLTQTLGADYITATDTATEWDAKLHTSANRGAAAVNGAAKDCLIVFSPRTLANEATLAVRQGYVGIVRSGIGATIDGDYAALSSIGLGLNAEIGYWRAGDMRFSDSSPAAAVLVAGQAPALQLGRWYAVVFRNCCQGVNRRLEVTDFGTTLPTPVSQGTRLWDAALPNDPNWASLPAGAGIRGLLFTYFSSTVWIRHWSMDDAGVIPQYWA